MDFIEHKFLKIDSGEKKVKKTLQREKKKQRASQKRSCDICPLVWPIGAESHAWDPCQCFSHPLWAVECKVDEISHVLMKNTRVHTHEILYNIFINVLNWNIKIMTISRVADKGNGGRMYGMCDHKYTRIFIISMYVIDIYHRIFLIENGPCSIYSYRDTRNNLFTLWSIGKQIVCSVS